MTEILGVRFQAVGKICYYPFDGEDISVGDYVIVLTKRGLEAGTVMIKKKSSLNLDINKDNERIIRKALTKDIENIQNNRQSEKQCFKICKQKIIEHGLKMKLVGAEYIFDRSKLIFYFVSDNRVDFRSLAKELAYVFKTRIELRQVGVRDEAKMIGGLGICGKPLCCATFLNEFQAVSVKMAKDQGISLNPTKISGICGRLMCCLKFEQDAYLDILYDMPAYNALVNTASGRGKVVSGNAISKTVKVSLENSTTGVPLTFNLSDIEILETPNEFQ